MDDFPTRADETREAWQQRQAAPVADEYTALRAAHKAGAMILGVEHDGRMHIIENPEWNCPASRYLAVVPYALLPTEPVAPLKVFSDGAWRYEETGQQFSAADLDEAAFAVYRTTPTEPAPDREDAERFAWLRANCEIDSTYCDVVKLSFPCEIDGFDTLDEAIDAARQEPE